MALFEPDRSSRSGLRATARLETWPITRPFIISRERFDHVDAVVVTVESGGVQGRGEGCPVPHHGETPQSVLETVEGLLDSLRGGADWTILHDSVPAGAARNAVDCALWDLRSKQSACRAWELVGLPAPVPTQTVFTISLDTPAVMAERAREARGHSILKLKLGGGRDWERVAAVRAAVPDKRLIADANEAWDSAELESNLPALVAAEVEMLEQPLPAGADDPLAYMSMPLLIGADESCHVTADLDRIAGRYGMVNIKLDKAGGLTEAVRLMRSAHRLGLETMVGCMLGTSLAMAPALLLASGCRYVDLDAPLLMGRDRSPALSYQAGGIQPPSPELWG